MTICLKKISYMIYISVINVTEDAVAEEEEIDLLRERAEMRRKMKEMMTRRDLAEEEEVTGEGSAPGT